MKKALPGIILIASCFTILVLISTCALYEPASVLDPLLLNAAKQRADLVSSASIWNFLLHFTEPRSFFDDPAEIDLCRDAIILELQNMGYTDIRTQPVTLHELLLQAAGASYSRYATGTFTMDTVIAVKPGLDASLRPVLVGAHYDTIAHTPGGNDNGSGCAGVLEIARVLSDAVLQRPVHFVFFAFEETGLDGSRHYVSGLEDHQLPHVVYILETLGFTSPRQNQLPFLGKVMPEEGDFLAAVGSSFSQATVFDFLQVNTYLNTGLRVFGALADKNVWSSPVTSNLLRSDHAPFWERGVPALMLTDTANFREGNYYHHPGDTIFTIDMDFLERVIQTIAANVYIQASLP